MLRFVSIALNVPADMLALAKPIWLAKPLVLPPPVVKLPTFSVPRVVPPAAPRNATVAPAPREKFAFTLLAPIVKSGVLMLVVDPAAVVTVGVAGFCAPVLLPIPNDVAAGIVLLAPRLSGPVARTLLLPAPPMRPVATSASKPAAAEASSVPEPPVLVLEVPIESAPVPPPPIEIEPPGAMTTLLLTLLLLPITSCPIDVEPPSVSVAAPVRVSVAVGPVTPPRKLNLAVPAPVNSVLFVSVTGALTLSLSRDKPASASRFTPGVAATLVTNSGPVAGAAWLMLIVDPPLSAPVPRRVSTLS